MQQKTSVVTQIPTDSATDPAGFWLGPGSHSAQTCPRVCQLSRDVISIFKGKARNVDYIFSCKLRLLERLVI